MMRLLAFLLMFSGSVVSAHAVTCVVVDPARTPQVVINIAQYPTDITGQTPPDFSPPVFARCTAISGVNVGWIWNGTSFVAPVIPPPTIKATISKLIDAMAAAGIITAAQATILHTAVGE